jgi:type 1 fimbriae regulatory protein FimB/type 1 fimbriae regulatory protein FimE
VRRPPPKRKRNRDVRSREYLTPREVDALITAKKGIGRHRHRNATLILVAYRHGLRASELVRLRWDQVDLEERALHVVRLKNGRPSIHPIPRVEARALRRLRRESKPSFFVFLSERGDPMTTANVRKVIAKAARAAGLPFPAHPHMLRHACGYKLANDGHDTRAIQAYLGHQCITHTVRYTDLAADRFKGFWSD